MPISVLNSKGSEIYIIPRTNFSNCTSATSTILAGVMVNCPQSLGELTETRDMQEYKCMSDNNTYKSLGSISRGSFDIDMILDVAGVSGQQVIRQAFRDNTPLTIGIKLPDDTLYYFDASISGVSSGFEVDEAIGYTTTIEISSEVHECSGVVVDCTISIGGTTGKNWSLVGQLVNDCVLAAA